VLLKSIQKHNKRYKTKKKKKQVSKMYIVENKTAPKRSTFYNSSESKNRSWNRTNKKDRTRKVDLI
jgi:hypothetical protein